MKAPLYIASPLFSEAERDFNSRLTDYLEPHYQVFLPQRDGELLVDLIARGEPSPQARRRIFQKDTAAIRECVAFVAVLDGRGIDEGVAFELGIAHSFNKVCIGLQTDPRRLLGDSNNPMIECALSALCKTREQLLEQLDKFLK